MQEIFLTSDCSLNDDGAMDYFIKSHFDSVQFYAYCIKSLALH